MVQNDKNGPITSARCMLTSWLLSYDLWVFEHYLRTLICSKTTLRNQNTTVYTSIRAILFHQGFLAPFSNSLAQRIGFLIPSRNCQYMTVWTHLRKSSPCHCRTLQAREDASRWVLLAAVHDLNHRVWICSPQVFWLCLECCWYFKRRSRSNVDKISRWNRPPDMSWFAYLLALQVG